MKKNKKGFTLIEILLVVILLGIVLSIILPSASLVIDKYELKSSLVSSQNYITGIEYKFLHNDNNDQINWFFVSNSKLSDVLESGEYPRDGIVTIYNNKVVEAKLCFFDKSVTYSNGEYSAEDTDKYCDYTQNAITQYVINNNDVNIENIDYDNLTIDTSVLTEDTKIFGVEYLNPDYLEYEKLLEENPEEAKKFEIIPKKYISNVGEIKSLKEEMVIAKNDDKTENNNPSFVNNKLQKVASITDSYYNLNETGYGTRMEDQGDLGLCWAYTATSMFETTLRKKIDKNLTTQFSPRHLDYFASKESIEGVERTRYYKGRKLGGGGNFDYVMNAAFTGLSIQEVSVFNDNAELMKKESSQVYNSNKINYYVKKATDLSFENPSEFAIKEIKQAIVDNGGVFGSICVNGIQQDYNLKSLVEGKTAQILRVNPKGDCSAHSVTIIGWDDSIGAWIAQNSWGTEHIQAYFYIDYMYEEVYPNFSVFEELGIKKWDNSYDFYNNFEEFYNAVYINKVNGNSEKIINIGFYKDRYSYLNNNDYYIVKVDSKADCKRLQNEIFNDYYTINNNKIYIRNSEQIGFVVTSPEMLDYGYQIFSINEDMIFEKDVCIISSDGDSRIPQISIFTQNITAPSSAVEMSIEANGKSNVNYEVDVLVNNKPGATVIYKIVDSNGKDVFNSNEVKITDNIVVNNVAHAKFEFKDPYQYTITSIVDSKESNSITINEGNLKEKEPEVIKDTTPPKCSWSSQSYKVTKKQKGKFYLICTDESGFSDTGISKSDITIPGLILKKLKLKSVSAPRITTDGKTVTWTVTVERGFLATGNSSLTLKAGVITDKAGNKNIALTTKTISVSRK